MIRVAFAASVAAVTLCAAPSFAADAHLKSAVDGPARAAENKARDAARHPAETLSFWGLKPKATVIEVVPGSGYWTEILAPYAKATGGRYVAGVTDLDDPSTSEGAKRGRAAFEAKYADAGTWGPIAYANFGPNSKPLGPANSADMVITARNIHNFIYGRSLDKFMGDFYAVLKPGGVLAVEEHRADPRAEAPNVGDGYVAVATVVKAAEKAGFKLAASSDVNANPKDTKDHPFGVWTLPPTNRSAQPGKPADPAFDGTKFKAIGESDRMTLRFVKPA